MVKNMVYILVEVDCALLLLPGKGNIGKALFHIRLNVR